MGKNVDIIKVITHADGGEEYSKNVSKYPSNEDSVAVRGYGVDANDPATAMMQFDTMAKYHGNEGKNQYIQYMMSFLKETAPDSETAMEITDKTMDKLKENHLILIGVHEKHREKSDFHTHNFVGTTNIETGKMLHPTNKLNFDMAQRMANIIQKPVELVIEKKNKTRKSGSTQFQVGTSVKGDNNKSKDFKRVFYPHKNTND